MQGQAAGMSRQQRPTIGAAPSVAPVISGPLNPVKLQLGTNGTQLFFSLTKQVFSDGQHGPDELFSAA